MLFDLTDRPARRVPGRVHVWEAWLLGVWLIALVALARLFPRSGDDWAWGAPEGWDRAQHLFAGINGRYAGNVAVVLLTRAGPLTPVVVAATVVATLVLVLHLARARTPLGYAVVGSLFLLMPLGVWRQGVVWLSGLVNYAFGTVFLLLLLVVARREADEDVPRSRPAALAACVLGGLVGALFMEHVTLCACLVGGALTVVGRVRSGSWPLRTAAWTAGSWSGAAVMFSNSAYRTALSGGSYQSVQATSGAPAQERLLVRLADYLPAHALTHVGSAAVALPALVLVLALSPRPDRRAAHAGLAALAVVVVGLEVQQLLGVRRDVVDGPLDVVPLATALLCALLVVLALRTGAVRDPTRRWTVTWAAVSLPLLVGPLLLVNPLGPRCFYPSYVLVLLLVGCLAGEVGEAMRRPAALLVSGAGHALTAGLTVALLLVYADISAAAHQQVAAARAAAAAGRRQVTISPLPHGFHVHDADPYWSLLQSRFAAYYDLPATLRLRLVPNPWLRVPGRPLPPAPP